MTRPISLAALTVLELTPPEMVTCAAEAGYSHVGIRLLPATPTEPTYDLIGITPLVREIRARSADLGIPVLDIEILRLKPETTVTEFTAVFETGAFLGAKYALIAGNDPDESRLTDNFAALCDLAAAYGIAPQLEPMPWTDAKNVTQAGRIVTNAGRANGGVLIDAIHFDRSKSTLDDIRALPPEFFGYAQICDAPVPMPTELKEILFQARCERLFPGEGGIDVKGIIAALPKHTPLSLEIPKEELARTVGATERARMALAALHKVLATLGD